jgi:hypothetical protein
MLSLLWIWDAMNRTAKNWRRDSWRPIGQLAIPAIAQDLGLDPEQISLDRRGPPQSPQQRSQAEHKFTFDRSASVVVGDDSCLETAVVVDIFDHLDDGFGAQTVPDRVSPRALFAGLRIWTGASGGIAPVSFDLSD